MSMLRHNLKEERDRFVAFAFANADILVELDEKGRIAFIDGATRGLLGKAPQDFKGREFADYVNPTDRDRFQAIFNGLGKIPRIDNVELSLLPLKNDPVSVLLSGFRLGLSNGKNHTYFTLAASKTKADVNEIFRRDSESGLLNKEGFVESANEKIREAQSQGKDVALTLVDFADLKSLLDSLPAEQAEALLAEISKYLREKSVDGDTAGVIQDGSFSVVHDSSITQEQMIADIAAITQKLDPKGVGATPQAVSVEAKFEALTEQDSANALLYTLNKFATQRGEAFSIQSLTEGYQEMLSETVERIADFKKTVSYESFDIAFQPIVDIKNGIVHHYECLVRLKDGSGFGNPFEFITFGEQAGLIGEFDLAMLQKTMDTLEEAAKQGNHPIVAVNVSGRSLSSNLFMDSFEKILNKYPKLRKQIIVEITESSKISDVEAANNFVQRLRQEGNMFCLDDFGTGESSFDYLRQFQVDFIKIDGSYVRESVKTIRGRQLLRAMSGLCQSLNVVTIGEMVEDEKVARLLWDCGIKFGQGYLFGKPTIDTETLANCSKPTPYYRGILRARRIKEIEKKWWAGEKSEG